MLSSVLFPEPDSPTIATYSPFGTEKLTFFKDVYKRQILSKPVVQCVDYIYSHIKERITVAVLAEYTGLSESYLSRVFKQNLSLIHI